MKIPNKKLIVITNIWAGGGQGALAQSRRVPQGRDQSRVFFSIFHKHRKSTKRPLSLGNDGLGRGGFLTGWQRPKYFGAWGMVNFLGMLKFQ